MDDRLAVRGQQGKSADRGHCAQGHDEGRQFADGDADTVDETDAETGQQCCDQGQDQRIVSLSEHGGQDAGKGYGGTDRHIKSAGNNDEHHTECQDSVDGCLLQNVDQVAGGDEARLEDRQSDDDNDENYKNKVFADQRFQIFSFVQLILFHELLLPFM